VGDHDNGDPLVQIFEKLIDAILHLTIDVGRGFIEEKNTGF
jgi:hypothetical protein